MITGAQIKAERKLLGWSQADLAARAKVAGDTIARVELGVEGVRLHRLAALRRTIELAGVKIREGEQPRLKEKTRPLGVRMITQATATSRTSRIENGEGPRVRLRKRKLILTGQEVRDARQLVGWSIGKLADKAALGKRALELFEQGQSDLATLHLEVLYDVLTEAGVAFFASGVKLTRK